LLEKKLNIFGGMNLIGSMKILRLIGA